MGFDASEYVFFLSNHTLYKVVMFRVTESDPNPISFALKKNRSGTATFHLNNTFDRHLFERYILCVSADALVLTHTLNRFHV